MQFLKKKTILVIIVIFAVLIGSELRFRDLGLRPMHTDEAVQAARLGDLIENKKFNYNPEDGHGPGLLYLSLPITWVKSINDYKGLDEITLRMVPALCGTLLIISLLLFKKLIGTAGVVAAIWLSALSPMHVYYSRYFIMEIPLVAILSIFIFCCWKYFYNEKFRWMLGAGICCAFMHATKETFIISVTALVIAVTVLFIWEEITDRKGARLQTGMLIKNTGISLGITLLISAALYSLLFTNTEAIGQSYLTYFDYLKRAEGHGHEKPFLYYIELLTWKKMELYTWSELLIICLAIIGAISSFLFKGIPVKEQIFIRSISLYTLITLIIYSSINYKTPWSILPFLHGATIVAGIGFNALWKIENNSKIVNSSIKGSLLLLFIFSSSLLYKQNRIANFKFPANADRNPYVYSHTSPSLVNKLVKTVNELQGIKGDLSVSVYHPEFGWPLPYYFRKISKSGYHQNVTKETRSDVIISDSTYDDQVTSIIGDRYIGPDLMNLRDNVMLHIYIEKELFFEMVNRRSK